jgi:CAAX protease family protein
MTSTGASEKRKLWAHLLPMVAFILLLGVGSTLKRPGSPLWLAAPELWIYALQTVLCAALLLYFRRDYQFHRLRRPLFVVAIALPVFLLWIAPQQLLHFPARFVGFDPDAVAADPSLYWATLALRVIRLGIVVPLVEEIFWRGFFCLT